MDASKVEVILHRGKPVLVEKKSVTIATIPVTGDALHESLVLHPRYVPANLRHEIREVQGYRRGRTIDILLDTPLVFQGQEYWLLNFKGVGADGYDRDMVIHPTLWRMAKNHWIHRRKADNFRRVYGAVKTSAGHSEFHDALFPKHQIAHVAHVAIHDMPQEISKYLSSVEGRRRYHRLSQIVRASHTNIRMNDFTNIRQQLPSGYAAEAFSTYFDAKKLGHIDGQVFILDMEFFKEEKVLYASGDVSDNRLMDGTFTDAENYDVKRGVKSEGIHFLYQLLSCSIRVCQQFSHESYFEGLEEVTGFPWVQELREHGRKNEIDRDLVVYTCDEYCLDRMIFNAVLNCVSSA